MGTDAEKGKYTKPEGSKTLEYLVVFTCTIMMMTIGFVHGWNSPSIVILMRPDSSIPISASDASSFVALTSVGFMVATLSSMYLVDKVGRRKIILLSALPMIVSWGLIIIASNVWILYVARFLKGIACGTFYNPLSMYLAEVVSPCLRGAAMTLNVLALNIGILMAYSIIPYMSILMSSAVGMGMAILFFVMFCFMPESPYYLAMKDRIEDAEAVLEKLRGKTDVSDELELVLRTIKFNSRRKIGGFKELVTVRANRRAFIINNIFICVMFFSGFYTIISFVQQIFQSVTFVIPNHMIAIVFGVVQVISVLITTFVIDRVGRKPLLLVSGIIVAIANLVIAIFFYVKNFVLVDVSAYSLVPFVATIVLMFANNCGAISVHLTVQSEIFATEIKAVATCLAGVAAGLMHVISAKTYILMTVTWGYGPAPAFLSYFVIVVICTAVILRITPETKGKTFVQIQKELDD